MSIHDLHKVIELIPEVEPLVKKANVEGQYPTDNIYSTLASYLEMEYLTKVAHTPIPIQDRERISKATKLYGIEKKAEDISKEMFSRYHEKQANAVDLEERLKCAESYFESQLSGHVDIEKVAGYAENLYDSYQDEIKSDEIKRYASAGYLDKEASVNALVARAKLTENPEFLKIARVIKGTKEGQLDNDDVRLICHAVTQLDKQANLSFKGFNFYKEAVRVKEAELRSSLKIKLGKKEVPVENIYRLGKARVASALDKDVADEMFSGSSQDMKSVAESLPMDMQNILARLASN